MDQRTRGDLPGESADPVLGGADPVLGGTDPVVGGTAEGTDTVNGIRPAD